MSPKQIRRLVYNSGSTTYWITVRKPLLIIFISILAAACSPKFDWREVQGKEAPFSILMPGKPTEVSREIQLGAQEVTMTMTATQIDGVSFAVGAAKMHDATTAVQTLPVIKNGLLKNIHGQLLQDESSGASKSEGKLIMGSSFRAVSTDGPATAMSARLVAQGTWVFQILVVGPEKEVNREAVETFLASFRPTGA